MLDTGRVLLLPLTVDPLLGGALSGTEQIFTIATVLGGHVVKKAIGLELHKQWRAECKTCMRR